MKSRVNMFFIKCLKVTHSARRCRQQRASSCAGQSIIEAGFVMVLICVIFMTILQVVEIVAAKDVLYYAAACSARCRTVGLNKFMVLKTGRVASIPNAGKMSVPAYQNNDTYLGQLVHSKKPGRVFLDVVGQPSPSSGQYLTEQSRIPDYMGADNLPRAEYILNYAAWSSVLVDPGAGQIGGGDVPQVMHISASQSLPLWVPLHRSFYSGDTVTLQADADIENHYALYLDDQSW